MRQLNGLKKQVGNLLTLNGKLDPNLVLCAWLMGAFMLLDASRYGVVGHVFAMVFAASFCFIALQIVMKQIYTFIDEKIDAEFEAMNGDSGLEDIQRNEYELPVTSGGRFGDF